MTDAQDFRPVVVAPTFNNDRTLGRVLRGMERLGLPVIVVNDGSTDTTADVLDTWRRSAAARYVVSHPQNRGKAAALRSGFSQAIELGATHVVTIDSDGQLDPAEIPRLLRLSRRRPEALVLGWRESMAPHYPTASRLGRWASNLLVNWESGCHVADSQCGLRVYPLALLPRLHCRAERYGFETEVLTRAAWAGAGIAQCHVSCIYDVAEGRVTHFRRWGDSLAAARMHIRLLTRSLMPWPVRRLPGRVRSTGTIWRRLTRWVSPVRAWNAVRRDPAERSRFAAALAVGVFVANLPLYGVQTLLCVLLARRLRLNPLPVVIGSHLSTPPIGPALVAMAIAVGHVLLYRTWPTLSTFTLAAGQSYGSLLRSVLLEWAIGGIVCGLVLGGTTFVLTSLLLKCVPARKPEAPKARREASGSAGVRAVAESAV